MAEFTGKPALLVKDTSLGAIVNLNHVAYIILDDKRGINTIHFTNKTSIKVYQDDFAEVILNGEV